MSDFSELLKEFLEEKNKNVISMAKYCDTDKSTMYKFLKASRTPASEELVRKMSAYLQLTPNEERKFLEAYQIAVNGKAVYFRRKEVEAFLRAPLMVHDMTAAFRVVKEEKPLRNVRLTEDQNDVESFLYEVLLSEAEKGNGKVQLYITDADERSSRFLALTLRKYPDLAMDYIVMINDDSFEYSREDSGHMNLRKLKCILPMSVLGDNKNFYYQYGTVSVGADRYLPYFTNILLGEDKAILFSGSQKKAMCITDAELCNEYRKLFEETMSVSKKLIVFADDLEQMFHYMAELSFRNLDAKMIFEMCPCFFKDVNEELLRKKIVPGIPEREALISEVLAYTKHNRSVMQSGKVTMIHCFEGYRDFMKNGLLRDVPSKMYIPLDMEERISMLERYISSIKKTDLHVLKEPLGPVENGFYVFLYDNSLMFQFLDRSGSLKVMRLDEFSYFETFQDYLESLIQNTELFYTRKELEDKLNELLQEYKTRYLQTVHN